MDPSDCEDCHQRTLRNKRGDAFNATANPSDERLETLAECSTSFREIKSYFHVSLTRCQLCGTVWLFGLLRGFRPKATEWPSGREEEPGYGGRSHRELLARKSSAAKGMRAIDTQSLCDVGPGAGTVDRK